MDTIYQFHAKTIDGQDISLDKYRAIKWNFSKFLINAEGKPVKRYSPQTEPLAAAASNMDTIYQFHAKTIDGQDISLDKYRAIKWNFSKFLINAEGKPVKRYSPQTEPLAAAASNMDTIYQFHAKTIDGQDISLDKYRAIKWNFSKFLINAEGKPVKRYSPQTEPLAIEKDIEPLLKQRG